MAKKGHFWPKKKQFDPPDQTTKRGKNFIKFLLSLLLQFDFTTKNSQIKGKNHFWLKKMAIFDPPALTTVPKKKFGHFLVPLLNSIGFDQKKWQKWPKITFLGIPQLTSEGSTRDFIFRFFLKFLPFVVHCVGIRVPKKIFRFLHFGPHFWPFSAFKLNFGPKFGGNPSGTNFFLASLQSFKRSVKKNRKKNAKIIPPPIYDTVHREPCLSLETGRVST